MATLKDLKDELDKLFAQKIVRPVPTKQEQVERLAQQKSYYQSPNRFTQAIRMPFAFAQDKLQNTPYIGDAGKATANAIKGTYDFGKALGTAAQYQFGGRQQLEQNQKTALDFMKQGNYQAASSILGTNQKEYGKIGSFTPQRVATGALSTLALGLGASQPINNPLGYAKYATTATGLGAGLGAITGGIGAKLSNEDVGKGVRSGAYQGSRQAFARSPFVYGTLQGTGPVLEKVFNKTAPIIYNSIKSKIGEQAAGQIANRVIPSIFNVVEGLGIDKVTDSDTTAFSVALDAIVGFVMGPSSFGAKEIETQLKKAIPNITPKQASDATKKLIYLRNDLGQYNGSKKVDFMTYGDLRRQNGLPDETTARYFQPSTQIEQIRAKIAANLQLTPEEMKFARRNLTIEEINRIAANTPEGVTRDADIAAQKGYEVAKSAQVDNLAAQRPGEAGFFRIGKGQQADEKAIKIAEDAIFGKADPNAKVIPQASTAQDIQKAQIQGEPEARAKFDELFAKWIGGRNVAQTEATQIGEKFANIPQSKAVDVIHAMEGTSTKSDVSKYITPLHKEFDSLHKEAADLGIDIGYRENYITHYWDQPSAKVAQEYQLLKQKEGFQNDRIFPTYEEGQKMGFTPKYTNPAQIITEYARRLKQLETNINFLKQLKKEGIIIDASTGSRTPGFAPITGLGFPKASSMTGENTVVKGNYYAPIDIAQQINRIFTPQDTGKMGKVFDISSNVSGKFQDIYLSGGVPYTPINAFTLANAQKEVLSGRITSPVSSVIRSLSPTASTKFFSDNVDSIKEMQARNVSISTSYRIENLIDQSTVKQTFGEKIGNAWAKAVNEPTFQRFLPMLQVNLYNDIKAQAIDAGKSSNEAADIAASAVKNFYGDISTADAAKRTKIGKDISSTFLFAPRYREAMINFWKQNIKALKNPTALENRTNIKFMIGSIITLASMNYLNQVYNGHGMAENGNYKEDKLLIPIDKDTTIGIPFLSSIATVPRGVYRQGKALIEGKPDVAAVDAFQTYTSALLKPVADIFRNQDYFGQAIYDQTDTTQEKLKKQGGYLLQQYSGHPYIRELTDQRNQNDPLYARISRAMELPIRFYDTQSIKTGPFWNKYFELKPFNEKYQELRYNQPEQKAFYAQNKDKIDQFNMLKSQMNAYYDQPEGQRDTNLLTAPQVQKPNFLQSLFKIKNDTPVQATNGTNENYVQYQGNDGNFYTLDLNKYSNPPKSTVEKVRFEKDRFNDAKYIYRATDLTDEQKQQYISKIGAKYEDVAYYDIAADDTDVRKAFIDDYITKIDNNTIVQSLAVFRKEVAGNRILTDNIIDDLYSEGVITATQKKQLKAIKWDTKNNTIKISGSGGSSKSSKSYTKLSLPVTGVTNLTPIPTTRSSGTKYAQISIPKSPKQTTRIAQAAPRTASPFLRIAPLTRTKLTGLASGNRLV